MGVFPSTLETVWSPRSSSSRMEVSTPIPILGSMAASSLRLRWRERYTVESETTGPAKMQIFPPVSSPDKGIRSARRLPGSSTLEFVVTIRHHPWKTFASTKLVNRRRTRRPRDALDSTPGAMTSQRLDLAHTARFPRGRVELLVQLASVQRDELSFSLPRMGRMSIQDRSRDSLRNAAFALHRDDRLRFPPWKGYDLKGGNAAKPAPSFGR